MILAGDDRSIGPIQPNRSRAQANYSHGGAIRRGWKPSGKIKFHVPAGSRGGNVRTKCLKFNLGLAQCSSEGAGNFKERGNPWIRDSRIILIIDGSVIVK